MPPKTNTKKPAPKRPTKLTPRQSSFCLHMLRLGNATQAYLDAGFVCLNREVAGQLGHRLLKNVLVQEEMLRLGKIVEEKTTEETARVLDLWAKAMDYDAREISELHRCACRYCHGKKHKYQWRIKPEFEEAMSEWQQLPDKKQEVVPTPMDDGGYGYKSKNLPHPDCPMCEGDGIEKVIFKDTRGYSKETARAYDGIVLTQNGMKVNTLSRMDASVNIAKYAGMFKSPEAEIMQDSLSAIIEAIQQKGSKAPLTGQGDAPVKAPVAPPLAKAKPPAAGKPTK